MREFTLTISKEKETVIHKIFADSFEIENNRIIFYENHNSVLGTVGYKNKVGSFKLLDDTITSYEITSYVNNNANVNQIEAVKKI